MSALDVVLLARGAFGLVVGGMLAYMVYTRYDRDSRAMEDAQRRYQPIVDPMTMPLILVLLTALILAVPGIGMTPAYLLNLLPGIFLQISVYYLALLLLLPLLRQRISARAVAVLWILPNYLYVLCYRWTELPMPALVLRADGRALRIALYVWLAGFCAVLLWKIVSHLIFRRRVLLGARPVMDADVLARWQQAQADVSMKKPTYRLMIAPRAVTPVSVGLWRWTIRVLLPERDYAPEELELIFRHELIHIRHQDTRAKLFLALCTAMCWFNPLMWFSMRRCAEDLELSCDEQVLEDAAEPERRQYAELLLTSAGDARGFTTCLSADAAALRYRLKNVLHPAKRRTGALIVGLAFFAMIMTGGFAALAFDPVSARDAAFGGDPDGVTCASGYVTLRDGWNGKMENMQCLDPEGLKAYLAGLECCRLTGNYGYITEGASLIVVFQREDNHFGVTVSDHMLSVNLLNGGNRENYYLYEPLDWDYVNAMLAVDTEK